jgi:hypothetical protein
LRMVFAARAIDRAAATPRWASMFLRLSVRTNVRALPGSPFFLRGFMI